MAAKTAKNTTIAHAAQPKPARATTAQRKPATAKTAPPKLAVAKTAPSGSSGAVVAAEPHVIKWRLLSSDQQPLKGIWVELRQPHGKQLAKDQVDDDGWVQFNVQAAGDYELYAHLGGDAEPIVASASVHSTWQQTASAAVSSSYWQGGSPPPPPVDVAITGKLEGPTGVDPSGTVVEAHRVAGGQPLAAVLSRAVVAADGTFVLLNIPRNVLLVIDLPTSLATATASRPDLVLTTANRVFCKPSVDADIGTFSYAVQKLGSAIRGRVVRKLDRQLTEPFPGVRVGLRDQTGVEVDSTDTTDSGEFSLTAKKAGKFTLVLARDLPGPLGPVNLVTQSAEFVIDGLHSFTVPYDLVYELVGARVIGQVTDGTRGLAGARVELFDAHNQQPRSHTTRADGFFEFSGIGPGTYELLFPNRFVDGGTAYEIQPDQHQAQQLQIVGTAVYPGPRPVAYQIEKHAVVWTVRTPDGAGVPNRLVEVFDPANQQTLAQAFTDTSGVAYLELDAPRDNVQVRTYITDTGLPALVDTISVQSIFRGGSVLPGSPSDALGGGGPGTSPTPLQESAIDLTAYPMLTESVSSSPTMPFGPTAGGGGGSLGQLAEGAIRDVLNWRPKDDPKAFQAALVQSFSLRDFEGHTEWKWTPRSYTVQTDLGAVTGAQASIYTRAKMALDQAVPLLEGLSPLRRDVLDEDLQSMCAVVKSELTQLVNEFGVLGGPRVQRIDELFRLLLGDGLVTDPQAIPASSELGILGNRFGMEEGRVNTIDDEQDLTNYLILVDYVISLRQSWNAQRRYFDGTPNVQPFLGTQLVILSRDLEVVAESVHDVGFAMDTVFMGPAERSALRLDFTSIQRPPMFVADLLDWVDRFASSEGPTLIQSSGKDGVNAFKPVVADLARHVRSALTTSYGGNQIVTLGTVIGNGTNGNNGSFTNVGLPPGYGTPRVQRALQALADQLAVTQQHAAPIAAPSLLGDPASLPARTDGLPQRVLDLEQQLAAVQRFVEQRPGPSLSRDGRLGRGL